MVPDVYAFTLLFIFRYTLAAFEDIVISKMTFSHLIFFFGNGRPRPRSLYALVWVWNTVNKQYFSSSFFSS